MRLTAKTLMFLPLVWLVTAAHAARATEYYHHLNVRYPSGLVKSFLGGPYSPKSWCEKQAQTVWDNVITVCGSCKRELQGCAEASKVPSYYLKTFRNEPIANPYVTVASKGRILFSGVGGDITIAECRHSAEQFRANGFPESRCITSQPTHPLGSQPTDRKTPGSPTYDSEGWTQESTGSAVTGPWLHYSPPGTRCYRDARGTIYRVFPPGIKPKAEKANPFGLGDSTECNAM